MSEGRSELKYALPVKLRREVLALAGGHAWPDTVGVPIDLELSGPMAHGYLVHTLYLDTPGLDGYTRRLEEARIRNRIRVRTYGHEGDDAALFLESKRKIHKKGVKHRIRAGGMRAWIEAGAPTPWTRVAESVTSPMGRQAAQRWLDNTRGMVPICTTHYEREVLGDARTRLSLDYNIRATDGSDPVNLQHDDAIQVLPPDWMVLELKFDGSMPGWMRALVRELGVSSEPISKFALGVAATRRRDRPLELRRLTPPTLVRAGVDLVALQEVA